MGKSYRGKQRPEIQIISISAVPESLEPGEAQAQKAAATRRAYGSDFEIFRAWCGRRKIPRMGFSARVESPSTIDSGAGSFAILI
jgi:hypothetical protein